MNETSETSTTETGMQKRTLGRNGLEVSAIGFGAMGMSQSYGPVGPRDEMIAVLRTGRVHRE
jgi:aryl-alcohol dehydrogenase-like predicted oxidoreductase